MQVALAAFFVASHRLGGRTIGSTSDSGSDYPGSSPGLPANSSVGRSKMSSLHMPVPFIVHASRASAVVAMLALLAWGASLQAQQAPPAPLPPAVSATL